jgi:hypothetical protein
MALISLLALCLECGAPLRWARDENAFRCGTVACTYVPAWPSVVASPTARAMKMLANLLAPFRNSTVLRGLQLELD